MADVLVLGGGICGLATSMILARDGHNVTVLERDPNEPPDLAHTAWESWERKGVVQFHQPHMLMPRSRHVLQANLPDLLDAMEKAGAWKFDFLALRPPTIPLTPEPEDDRFWTVTGRRPTVESVFAHAAANEPRVDVKRGVQIAGLVKGPSASNGIPHVVGVRTADGEEMRADLVVDATGRRSPSADWLEAIGAKRPYEDASDAGITYYTRYYIGHALPAFAAPLNTTLGTIGILTLPGDSLMWSITIYTSSHDRPMKRLRDEKIFTEVVRASPRQKHWLDGVAVTDVLPMGGILDRYRRFVVDDEPIVTGFVAVADAWACTNPSAGRGISLGLGQAARLRDVIHETQGNPNPRELAERWDAILEEEWAPWYWAQITADRARVAEIDAMAEGREPPPAMSALYDLRNALFAHAGHDADVFRALLDTIGCLALPPEILARPGMREKLAQPAPEGAGNVPGPTREELLEIVTGQGD